MQNLEDQLRTEIDKLTSNLNEKTAAYDDALRQLAKKDREIDTLESKLMDNFK